MATSAGIVLYRRRQPEVQLLLVHPGGPFWAKKDDGAWSFPKGEHGPTDDPLAVALREFREETGQEIAGEARPLGEVKQSGGKVVRLFAIEGDCDADAIRSNTFTMEWPPRSGRRQEFPEVDRAAWFGASDAKRKLNPAQALAVDRLLAVLGPG